MKKKIIIVAILAVCVIVILAARPGRTPGGLDNEPVLPAAVEKKTFDVKITESGVLDALRSVTLSSEIPSNNAKIIYLVPEGTQVAAGDVAVRFDPTPFQADVQKFQFQLNEAKAALKEVAEEAELEKIRAEKERKAAQHTVRLAELELENVMKGDGPVTLEDMRAKSVQARVAAEEAAAHRRDLDELYKEGFVNDEEKKKAQTAAEAADSGYALAQLRYDAQRDYIYPAAQEKAQAELAKARNEGDQLELSLKHQAAKMAASLQRADAAVQAAQESLRTASEQLEKTIIKAPIPGFVVYREAYLSGEKRKPRIGDSVWLNQGIMTLPDISTMVVESKVREVDIHKLKVGQEVQVTVDAYPEPAHTGIVDLIGTLASADPETKSAAKYFSLRIILNGTDARLRPGMSTRVDVLVEQVRDKLTVPVNAVFREGQRTFCYVWDGSRARQCEVKTGPSDNFCIVIESGLKKGEKVCLRRPAEADVAGRE